MWKGSRPKPTPRTIVSMSLQLAIPRRVTLQQSPPPLHQPRTILEEKTHRKCSPHLNVVENVAVHCTGGRCAVP